MRRAKWSRSQMFVLGLALVSAVAFGTLGISAESRMSQLAATEATVTTTSPKDCTTAIKKALRGMADNDGPATDTVSGTGTGGASGITSSECFGAVITEQGKQKRTRILSGNPYGEKLTEQDYRCTGRSGTSHVSSEGTVSNTTAKDGVPPRKCDTEVTSEKPGGQGGKPEGSQDDKCQQNPQDPSCQGGEGKPPELPKPPEKKPEEQKPQEQPQQQDCNTLTEEEKKKKPECRGLEGQEQLNQALQEKENQNLLSDVASFGKGALRYFGSLMGVRPEAPEALTDDRPTAPRADASSLTEDVQQAQVRAEAKAGPETTVAQNSSGQSGYQAPSTGFAAPKTAAPETSRVVGASMIPPAVISGLQSALSGIAGWLRSTFGL